MYRFNATMFRKLYRLAGALVLIMVLFSIAIMLHSSYQATQDQVDEFITTQVEQFSGDTSADLNRVRASELWSERSKPDIDLIPSQSQDWLRVRLTNRAHFSIPFIVLIDNPLLDILDFFVIDEQGNVVARRFLGTQRTLERSSDYSMPRLELALEGQSTVTVYIYAKSGQSLALPLYLYSEGQWLEHRESVLLLWGGIVGLTLIVMLYFLSLYRVMTESVYLAYAFFSSVTMMYLAQLYGIGFHILPIDVHRWFVSMIGPVALLQLFAMFVFSRQYVALEWQPQTVDRRPWLRWLVLGLILVSSLLPPRLVVHSALILQPLLFIFLSVTTLAAYRGRQGWAQLYLLSWIPVFIGLPLTTLAVMGWIESTLLTRYALLLAMIAQFALTAMSFSARMNMVEKSRIRQATHDRYTHLPNRSALTQSLVRWSNSHLEYALVFIEVGNFLRFLPYVGAERAARLINEVADLIRNYWIQHREQFTELGSVQYEPPYLVRDHLLAIIVRQDAVRDCINGLYQTCNTDVLVADIEISVHPIVGVSVYPQDATDPDELIQKAMQALDFAKRSGLTDARYNQERMQHSAMEVQIATDLPKAMQHNELQLYHQPQMKLKDFTVVGSEVLLRWPHPQLGWVAPDLFVKVAEDIGLMTDLTQWVIDTALAQHRRLGKAGFQHQISINISGRDVASPDFYDRVVDLLMKHETDPKHVTLELTESVAVRDQALLQRLMSRFHSIGVRFSLDDFGTGYSSLEALSQLEFDELKIDRSFVQNMLTSERDYTIASATLALANKLQLETVAEGIENEKVIAMLIASHCGSAQGYYFSKPKPFDDYLTWLKQSFW